ncbi:DUF3159 domain-containing protein [Streptomyces durbertensis]|uniref:DUF3159 domain-containing protein n=1 Tax=Streptomyces durbertensis TaxID=2448886 RepID=A0ABR6EEX1_9ACTN|nr:DUF3159 domain-containing protein [Streptomyces durbertensis]MBB1243886.1 DUF3159 domain-containing protein [Streptomyces durbertensis]
MTPLDKPTADPAPAADTEVTKAAFLEAFGGVRGMVETTVPGLVFVLSYTVNRDIHVSAIAALCLSAVMALLRLARRDTVKHAFSGVFGVAIGAVFAMMSGDAKNFYLPGMLYTLGLAVAYLASSAAGWPLLGLILGPLFRENLSWRTRNPGRKAAYTKASYAWGLVLLAKSAITFPIYFWGDATQLGWLRVALGIPPFLLCVYLTWIFLAKAPAPIDVIAEMEAEEERERAAEAAAKAAGEPQAAGEAAARADAAADAAARAEATARPAAEGRKAAGEG